MAKRDIRIVGDPVLRTECDPIKDITLAFAALSRISWRTSARRGAPVLPRIKSG